jgi:transcriptional regulator with XRE-family HTH domain
MTKKGEARASYTTKQKAEARKMRQRGLSLIEIEEKTGTDHSTIARWVKDIEHDWKAAGNLKRYADARAKWFPEAQKLLKNGLTRNEISKRLGVSKNAVYTAFKIRNSD